MTILSPSVVRIGIMVCAGLVVLTAIIGTATAGIWAVAPGVEIAMGLILLILGGLNWAMGRRILECGSNPSFVKKVVCLNGALVAAGCCLGYFIWMCLYTKLMGFKVTWVGLFATILFALDTFGFIWDAVFLNDES